MDEPDCAWDEAIREGEVKRSHEILLRLGTQRFGPPDTATKVTVTEIRELRRLDFMVDAILTAKSWPELLATVPCFRCPYAPPAAPPLLRASARG